MNEGQPPRSSLLPDTAPIRKGEDFNYAAIEDYLHRHLPAALGDQAPDASGRVTFEQFPGGHSNLTYCLRVGGQEFVLRRPPLGPIPPTAHDMPREYRLLASIHPHFPLAPRPLLLCEDPAVIGAPFYLMERRQGLVVRQIIPPEMGDNLDLRRRLSASMVDTLADLHAIDIEATGLSRIGKPIGFVRRQVEGWAGRWERARTTDLPDMNRAARWLLDHLPADPARPTIVHNDYKLDNVMLNPADPTRLVAVLDWEMSTVGDPLVDLGLLLCYWPQSDDPELFSGSLRGVTALPGWMRRDQLIARYAERSGRDLSGIAYYHVFAVFKLAVVLQQIYYRFHNGQTSDQRFADFDQRVSALAAWAAVLIDQSR